MDKQTKYEALVYINVLKKLAEEKGLIFAFMIDEKNNDNSKLALLEKDEYIHRGNVEGMFISLNELNKGLV